ncbi:MAG TPA: DUF4157 domain-containing protein, partial [Thermoanaerobaculia bacterium]|nr:DUF4157 domain-containing protein [Thermoanaerobaculia bacterium]
MKAERQPRAKESAPSVASAPTNLAQRKCACSGTSGLGGECTECQEKRLNLQRKPAGPGRTLAVPPLVDEVLASPGRPLDEETRTFMESRFGFDFSRVQVHADGRAADSARAVNALAFTVGRDVVFGSEQYAPHTKEGRRLLG